MLKLRRAEHGLHTLGAEVAAFFETEPYDVREEFRSDERKFTYTVIICREPPAQFGVIVGEIVHNLRSALDQAVWQLTRARIESRPPRA